MTQIYDKLIVTKALQQSNFESLLLSEIAQLCGNKQMSSKMSKSIFTQLDKGIIRNCEAQSEIHSARRDKLKLPKSVNFKPDYSSMESTKFMSDVFQLLEPNFEALFQHCLVHLPASKLWKLADIGDDVKMELFQQIPTADHKKPAIATDFFKKEIIFPITCIENYAT